MVDRQHLADEWPITTAAESRRSSSDGRLGLQLGSMGGYTPRPRQLGRPFYASTGKNAHQLQGVDGSKIFSNGSPLLVEEQDHRLWNRQYHGNVVYQEDGWAPTRLSSAGRGDLRATTP